MHLICYHPYYSCLCTFWPYHPYLHFQFIQLLFILVCIDFLIAQLLSVRGVGTDMGQVSSCRLLCFTASYILKRELQSTTTLSLSMTSALIDSECEVYRARDRALALQRAWAWRDWYKRRARPRACAHSALCTLSGAYINNNSNKMASRTQPSN